MGPYTVVCHAGSSGPDFLKFWTFIIDFRLEFPLSFLNLRAFPPLCFQTPITVCVNMYNNCVCSLTEVLFYDNMLCSQSDFSSLDPNISILD